MKIYSETNIGNGRKNNQDYCDYGYINENCAWAIMCDGMGGANGGDIASKLACEVVSKTYNENFKTKMKDHELMELNFKAVELANNEVYSLSQKDNSLKGMGTTLGAILINNKTMCVSNVGDSRAYLKRNGETMQITMDHSLVQELINQGQISEMEAKVHPHRNIITRSIGVHEKVENDYSQIDLEDGDIIVSCTDGLSTYLTEEILNAYLENYSQEEITGKLIELALNNGGSDNITVCAIYL